MEILIGFFLVLLSCLTLAGLVHGQDQSGFINIDCGAPEDFSFTDDETGISYSSDGEFIETGINVNISSVFMSNSPLQPFSNVRSFPKGNKNCYTLRPAGGMGNKYLIRAYFLYGNYDGRSKLPQFDLYLGVNHWYTVELSDASDILITEIISVASSDVISVCLINTGLGTPFISILELRPLNGLNSSIYDTSFGSLVLETRADVGSTTNQFVRYKDDVYDRIWAPYIWDSGASFDMFSATDPVMNEYKVPSTVMTTAVRPANSSDTLEFSWTSTEATSQYFLFMHFAELDLLERNQLRKFNISCNGKPFYGPIVPKYLSTDTIYQSTPFTGYLQYEFVIDKTLDSTLPPILNAIELYTVKQFPQSPTKSEDVDAITNIKATYQIQRNWVGDPCLPKTYYWNGLNCSYIDSNPPSIISLNLASSNLTGDIAASLAKLTSIESLDLSNNSLTGPVPEFLSKLPSLRLLSLKGNQLAGSVPTALIERSKDGLLSLSVDKQNLCALDSCKENNKDKKIIIPVVASVTSAVVLLIVVIIVWRLKRRRQPVAKLGSNFKKEGISLASNNQQFTYVDIVSITNNFQRIIGKGGFGTVYHGYLENGTEVAVKMLSQSSSQGPKEFQTEAELLTRVHHRNLASFVGYCDEGSNIALIYEYMANGNLKEHLKEGSANALSWERRLRIAIDSAQGLEYLHNGCKPPIIHRDVKSSNILLSERLEAKIADFGLSKLYPSDGLTHVSTAAVGTPGYLDPEYCISDKLNEKSDVYSFGIVLLELITGQPAIIQSTERIHIIQWVSPMLARGEIRNIVDPRLQGNFNINSTWKATEIAIACTSSTTIQRPTMSQVLSELKECFSAHENASISEEGNSKSSNSIEMIQVDHESMVSPSAR